MTHPKGAVSRTEDGGREERVVGVCDSALAFTAPKAGFPSPIDVAFEVSCELVAGDRFALRLPQGFEPLNTGLGGGSPMALRKSSGPGPGFGPQFGPAPLSWFNAA